MQYSFDVQEACDYGINEAILIWNLRFWIIKNKANNKHQYPGEDGIIRTWTYNTSKAFVQLFPFWSEDQIDRLIKKMISKEIIIKGNFNQNAYDRTSWFAFKDESKFMTLNLVIAHSAESRNAIREITESNPQNREMDSAKTGNGFRENGKSNIETDIKPNVNKDKNIALPSEIDKELWEDYLKARKEAKFANTPRAEKLLINDLQEIINQGFDANESLKDAIKGSWGSLYAPKNGKKLDKKTEVKRDKKAEEEQKEIDNIRSRIKYIMHNKIGDFRNYGYFTDCKIQKINGKFTAFVENKKALEFQSHLADLVNIELITTN
jgi:hypothetical protein